MPEGDTKVCDVCGRVFSWRKKWERDWPNVKHCSNQCRRRGRKPVDEQLEHAILELLAGRDAGKSICPSEAAKAVGERSPAPTARGRHEEEPWRELMEPARMAARRLVHAGKVEMTQRGRPVDASTARGPIRIRLAGR